MKRILVVAGLADSLINFRGHLLAAFRAHGYEVHAAAPELVPGSEIWSRLEQLGVTPHDIPLRRTSRNGIGDIRLMLALIALIRQIRPSQMLCYTVKPVIYGTLAAWIARVPSRCVLITGLGYAFQKGRGRQLVRMFVRSLYSLALSKAEVVFFQNPDDRDLFISQNIVQRTKRICVVNGSGVNVQEFQFVPTTSGTPRFLLIARLLGDKGVREYAQAAARLKQRFPHAQFMLAGWLDENPDCITRDELNGWVDSGVIEFLGRLSDVRPALQSCSVFVLPSYREGTPRTVLEAMAVGRAVITTDAPGCRETVTHGTNGLLVPPRAVEELVDAMSEFIERPHLAGEMGLMGRQIAEQKYDVHVVNKAMMAEMTL